MSPYRVLLVDDQALFRQCLRRLLRDVGEVEVIGDASDAAEAARQVRHLRPDVAVIDARMLAADGGGAGALKRECPGLRVVALMASDDGSDVLGAVRAGADAYVAKSAPAALLIRSILGATDGALGGDRVGAGRRIGKRAMEGTLSYLAIKRLVDILLASGALVVLGPVILLAGLAVKLTSAGPAFYRSKRAGLNGKPFAMYKVRTMRCGADSPDRRITAADDDRVTAVGALLRRCKVDELPQFWNVLRGDMAIVGPRPEDWDIVQRYYTPEQRRVLRVRPGIASPVDLRWYPDFTYHDPPPEGVAAQDWYIRRHLPVQVAEGIRYAERPSLRVDLAVILGTLYCVAVRSWLRPKRRPLVGAPAVLTRGARER